MRMSNFLIEFKKTVKCFPDNIALSHYISSEDQKTINYIELDKKSDAVAVYLKKKGVKAGEFIGIYMHKSLEHVITILGIIKAGCIFYTINSKNKLLQVNQILNVTKSRFLFVDNFSIKNLFNIERFENRNCKLIYFSNGEINKFYESILKKIEAHLTLDVLKLNDYEIQSMLENPNIFNEDAAFILFTSGSTGRQKGVLISQQDLLSRARTECADYKLTDKDCLLSLLPFSFDVGCNQLFTSLISGSNLVILNSWLPKDILNTILKYEITGISGVPIIWATILDNLSNETMEIIKKVRYITISGGDLDLIKLEQLKDKFTEIDIYKTYGQTETFRSGILKPEDFLTKYQSVGKPVNGTHIFILNSNWEETGPNELGEIFHYGNGTMIGYVNDRSETKKKLRANPLNREQKVIATGDIGKIDKDGYLYIMGRKDKMIKTSGFRVYPKEIENIILTNINIEDAFVFGIKDEKKGEELYCEIKLRVGKIVTITEILTYLNKRLPSYMVPSKIFFVDKFPKTETGKIKINEVEKKYYE